MYQFKSRVRYSETGVDARLSLMGIMNYMQDCSTFQSEDCGVGLAYLEEKNRAWLLSSWQIQILRRPALGEEITVCTWPYEIKGIYGLRNFTLMDGTGEYLVKANSCWFLLDTEAGKPVRVTREDVDAYGDEEPKLSMDYAPRKIRLPEHMEEAGRLVIMKHQIDTNHHVNNAQYVDMAVEALPEEADGREITEIRAEYKKAAVLGDTAVLMRAAGEDGYVVSVCGGDGSIFANVELKVTPEGSLEKREDEGHAGTWKNADTGDRKGKGFRSVSGGIGKSAGGAEKGVLLPKKQVPEGAKTGDPLEVFLYKDSEDRIIATTTRPKISLGETAVLEVKETSKIGAFLDMGLEKDLLLPFKEQTHAVKKGEKCLVALYVDKSKRLAATMKVYSYLRSDAPYKTGDDINGFVFEINPELGAFVAVDGIYHGMIPRRELFGGFKVGPGGPLPCDKGARDGKLDLSAREKAYNQIFEDAELVLKVIGEFDGVLPFNDKADPEVIAREFKLSKNAFKRAVGHLLKEGKIEITEKSIRVLEETK